MLPVVEITTLPTAKLKQLTTIQIEHLEVGFTKWILSNIHATSGTRTYFRALPTGQYSNSGYGVSACYNSQTGATKVVERTVKGRSVPNINC